MFQVNGVDLRGASHEEAIAALRQTPAKVLLTVLRDEAQYRDEENLDVFEVELQKKSGRGLGFSIVGKRSALNIHTHTVTLCVGYYHTCVCVCVCMLGVAVVCSSQRWSKGVLLSWTAA